MAVDRELNIKQRICLLCSSKRLTSACLECQDYSCFQPDLNAEIPGLPNQALGIRDISSLSPNGRLSLLLWLIQKREKDEAL